MTDRRTTPFNGRVALKSLRGQVDAKIFVAGTRKSVAAPVVDLRNAPDGRRERQIQFGAAVLEIETRDEWTFVQSLTDGYVGYVKPGELTDYAEPTHIVASIATHAYEDPNIKSRDGLRLGLGARVRVLEDGEKFVRTDVGHIPKNHLRGVTDKFTNPVEVAKKFLSVPYLWGGNSALGIDCSGLVQASLLACGIGCPGDSDMQEGAVGSVVPQGDDIKPGDLFFWKGHVAMAADANTLIHANAHHMAVQFEAIDDACRRIEVQGDGPVTSIRRF